MNASNSHAHEFKDGRCPLCGKLGTWNFVTRRMECKSCSLSGFGTTSFEAAEKQRASMRQPPQPTESTKTPVTQTSNDWVTETYFEKKKDGSLVTRTVRRYVPKKQDRYIPDLMVNVPMALFTKHRLAKLIEQEKRWGRDNLRKRGFKRIGTEKDERGHSVKLWARPDAKEIDVLGTRVSVGTGTPRRTDHTTLAVEEARQVARNHARKPLEPEPTVTEEDLMEMVAEVNAFLAALRS